MNQSPQVTETPPCEALDPWWVIILHKQSLLVATLLIHLCQKKTTANLHLLPTGLLHLLLLCQSLLLQLLCQPHQLLNLKPIFLCHLSIILLQTAFYVHHHLLCHLLLVCFCHFVNLSPHPLLWLIRSRVLLWLTQPLQYFLLLNLLHQQ